MGVPPAIALLLLLAIKHVYGQQSVTIKVAVDGIDFPPETVDVPEANHAEVAKLIEKNMRNALGEALSSCPSSPSTGPETTTPEQATRTVVPTSTPMTAGSGDEIKTTRPDLCMLQYNDTCFWFKIQRNNDVNLKKAEEMCAERGSKPANVYNQNQYQDMMDLIRQNISDVDKSAQVWTGMTINTATKKVSFNNGTSALFVAWAKDEPNTFNSARTKIGVAVAKDSASTSEGMFNTVPGRKYHGVICERQIQI